MQEVKELLKYNDNELLYLLKEGSDDALEILFCKYSFFIELKIKEMNIEKMYVDEFYQEGLIALHNAIKKFNDQYNNTFYTFFNVILTRKYLDLLRKNSKEKEIFVKPNNDDYFVDLTNTEEMLIVEEPNFLTDLEREVFEKKYRQFLENKEIAMQLGKSIKAIYSTIERIKGKYRNKK